jgi:hypothetical protein
VAVEGLGPEEGSFGGKKAYESGTMSKYPGGELEANSFLVSGNSSTICAGEGVHSVMVVECKRLKLRIVVDPFD